MPRTLRQSGEGCRAISLEAPRHSDSHATWGGAFGPGSPALLIERHGCLPFASLAWLLLRLGSACTGRSRV